jgi:hypothetical protein
MTFTCPYKPSALINGIAPDTSWPNFSLTNLHWDRSHGPGISANWINMLSLCLFSTKQPLQENRLLPNDSFEGDIMWRQPFSAQPCLAMEVVQLWMQSHTAREMIYCWKVFGYTYSGVQAYFTHVTRQICPLESVPHFTLTGSRLHCLLAKNRPQSKVVHANVRSHFLWYKNILVSYTSIVVVWFTGTVVW